MTRWNNWQCIFPESYRAHRLLADSVVCDRTWKVSGYCFLLPREFICCWIWCDEGIYILCTGNKGPIMKVVYLKKQPKNPRFYYLVSFTEPHVKPLALESYGINAFFFMAWKRKHLSYCLSLNISSLQNETESHWRCFWSEIRRRIRFFTCCCKLAIIQAGQKVQSATESHWPGFLSAIRRRIRFLHAIAIIQAGQKVQSKIWRKQIFVFFNDCKDRLQNVDEIIHWPFPVNRVFIDFSIGGWQTLKLVLFYNHFF